MSTADFVRRLMALLAALVVVGASMLPRASLGESAGIDPRAEQLLKAATDYLGSQQRFGVETRSTIEVVLDSGQKIQFDHAVALKVQRPNKLRAERHGDLVDQVFYYDGQALTLQNPADGLYATVAAPGTLEEMLDFARESLDIVAPAGDLIYRNAFAILMQDVTDGFVVGKGVVEGVRCDHLAFRSPHADWQIWVQEGDAPLPRKLVITTRDVVNAPQFAVVMSQWDLEPELADDTFVFRPPSDARAIDFLPLSSDGTQSR